MIHPYFDHAPHTPILTPCSSMLADTKPASSPALRSLCRFTRPHNTLSPTSALIYFLNLRFAVFDALDRCAAP